MNKKDRKAITVVIEELSRRLPLNNKEGFLPSQEVFEAIEYLVAKASKSSRDDIKKQESNTLIGMINQTINK